VVGWPEGHIKTAIHGFESRQSGQPILSQGGHMVFLKGDIVILLNTPDAAIGEVLESLGLHRDDVYYNWYRVRIKSADVEGIATVNVEGKHLEYLDSIEQESLKPPVIPPSPEGECECVDGGRDCRLCKPLHGKEWSECRGTGDFKVGDRVKYHSGDRVGTVMAVCGRGNNSYDRTAYVKFEGLEGEHSCSFNKLEKVLFLDEVNGLPKEQPKQYKEEGHTYWLEEKEKLTLFKRCECCGEIKTIPMGLAFPPSKS
jgi:hypothetical protein